MLPRSFDRREGLCRRLEGYNPMNIDLTAEELGRIVQWAEAANMADPLTASLHLKALRLLQNIKPRGYDDDPQAAAEKWKAPI